MGGCASAGAGTSAVGIYIDVVSVRGFFGAAFDAWGGGGGRGGKEGSGKGGWDWNRDLTRLPSGQAKRANRRTAMPRMVETMPDAMASLVGAT